LDRASSHVEHAVIRAHRADLGAVITALWTQAKKLQQAMKVFGRESAVRNTRQLAYAATQFDLPAGSQE
jgi:hypothetical protein